MKKGKCITHWRSYSEIKELDGSITVTPEGAACKGLSGQHAEQKLALGVRDEVDCKTCVRMRDALKASEKERK